MRERWKVLDTKKMGLSSDVRLKQLSSRVLPSVQEIYVTSNLTGDGIILFIFYFFVFLFYFITLFLYFFLFFKYKKNMLIIINSAFFACV